MDWLNLNIFYQFFLNWWPWISFWNDSFFLQFLILYTMYLIYSTNNLYFTLFYLFIEFFYFGLFLALYNLELFTAFLWLTECVIVFVSLLFLFYLNVFGNVFKINLFIYSFKYFGVYFGFFLLTSFYIFPSEIEFFLPIEFNIIYMWDDYYEALWNDKMNDLFGLYIGYYLLNSFEFLLIGVLLLIGSIVCVNINKFNKNLKSNNYYDLLTIFDFFDDFIKYLFMRKQNLVDQALHPSSTRIFKKKVNK
jgi:hypothetical protein